MISPAFGRATSADAARGKSSVQPNSSQQLLKRGLFGGAHP
jgi:hypothetical protein